MRPREGTPPANALEVRDRIMEALQLDLVGPWAGHQLAKELLPGWIRPSNWYLTGFVIPTGTPPEESSDPDEDDDLGEIPEVAGLAEENVEERKAAKKGFFPSSMGLSFLVAEATEGLTVAVRWARDAHNPTPRPAMLAPRRISMNNGTPTRSSIGSPKSTPVKGISLRSRRS